MSVRVNERSEGTLQVLRLSTELCVYTLSILKNEKVFPKSQRWLLTSKIASEAVDLMTCVRRANAVLLCPGPEGERDYRYRRAQQIEAHSHVGALLSLIDVAYQINHIEERRIRHWTGLVVDTDQKLKSWMRSDKERMKKK